MKLHKILGVILVFLSILLLGFEFNGLERYAIGVKALAMCFLIALYFIKVPKRSILFLLFFITYLFALIIDYALYMSSYSYNNMDLFFIVCNGVYALAYVFLIFRILYLFNFIKSIVKFPIQSISLILLGVFLVYMITDVTTSKSHAIEINVVQIVYVSIIVFMICLSVINYIYNDSKKAIILMLGTVLIVFSEIIQIAYYYLTDLQNGLNIVYSLFVIGAFTLFYFQSKLGEEQKVFKGNIREEVEI